MELIIEPTFRETFVGLGLRTCADAVRYFTGGRQIKPGVLVEPTSLPVSAGELMRIYYKQYEYGAPSWSFLGRASKARREWESYAAFTQCGIACAQRIATGEERDGLGRLVRALIITRAVEESKTLAVFEAEDCRSLERQEARVLRMKVILQLAEMTRRIHARDFFHNDLYWRNILVSRAPDGTPELRWIDCPRGSHARFYREHRRIKDLACLDRMAAQRCSRRERLEFVRVYLQKKSMDADVIRLAGKVVAYQRRRWPQVERS